MKDIKPTSSFSTYNDFVDGFLHGLSQSLDGDYTANKKTTKRICALLQDENLEIDIDLINNLKEVNKNLWEIEDNIRIKERNQEFDKEFVELARSVYKENDKRAYIKKEINQKYNSELVEEKSYNNYLI